MTTPARRTAWTKRVLLSTVPVLLVAATVVVVLRFQSTERRFGIEVNGVRLSAADYLIDFRYRVVDSEKAAELMRRDAAVALVDQETGATMHVPTPPKVGPLRQTTAGTAPIEGRTYFVLFANPGRFLKPGAKVNVTIGDFQSETLELM